MLQVSRSQISDEKVILFYFSFKIEIQYTKYITASSQNTYFTLGMWKKKERKSYSASCICRYIYVIHR